jgi:nucleoside-diphosphate-sugar epimerase
MCEPLLKKHTDQDFVGVIFRPATICGYAPRQRLDLSVNILVNLAVNKRQITVFGGSQMRPNLHIQDYCDAIKLFMSAPVNLIQNETFNVGYQNLTIKEIAEMVKTIVESEFSGNPIDIVTTSTDDNRSYHINSDKITRILGFRPKNTIEDAIYELCAAFKSGKLPNSLDDDQYFNVKRLKRIHAQ